MRVIDVADDLGAFLKDSLDRAGLLNAPPEAIKTASWVDVGSARDRDFALILLDTDGTAHRKYACHDPGNTVVSMLYLENALPHLNKAAVKVAAANLSRIARDWGLDVPEDIDKLASAQLDLADQRDVLDERRVVYRPPPLFEKRAEPAGPFAKLASVRRSWEDMSPEDRHVAAVELSKEAAHLPLVLPDDVFRYSGETLSPRFAAHMQFRESYASDPEVAEAYRTLAKTASLFPPEGVVAALYAVDEAAHLRWAGGDRYGKTIPDPVLCVYDRVKEAAFAWNRGSDFVTEHDLVIFQHRDGARQLFTDVFTDELWTRFCKDPVGTFKAMPLEQKALFSRMAREE